MTPSRLTWVDPNDGWHYGFPKLYDPDKDGDMKEWLTLEGYPIDQLLYTRCWYATEEDKKDE